VRQEIEEREPGAGRRMDLLVVEALSRIGESRAANGEPIAALARKTKILFSTGLRALLDADRRLFSGRHAEPLQRHFSARGIVPGDRDVERRST